MKIWHPKCNHFQKRHLPSRGPSDLVQPQKSATHPRRWFINASTIQNIDGNSQVSNILKLQRPKTLEELKKNIDHVHFDFFLQKKVKSCQNYVYIYIYINLNILLKFESDLTLISYFVWFFFLCSSQVTWKDIHGLPLPAGNQETVDYLFTNQHQPAP